MACCVRNELGNELGDRPTSSSETLLSSMPPALPFVFESRSSCKQYEIRAGYDGRYIAESGLAAEILCRLGHWRGKDIFPLSRNHYAAVEAYAERMTHDQCPVFG